MNIQVSTNIDFNQIRAWKDEEYRETLTQAQRELLVDNPAGQAEVTEDELDLVVGGATPTTIVPVTISVVVSAGLITRIAHCSK